MQDYTSKQILTDTQNLKAVSSSKLIGVEFDDKQYFNVHGCNICKSAANQLIAMIRLKNYLSLDDRKL